MLQVLDVILTVLLKYLLSRLVVIALIALENIVCYILNNYLHSMLSNAYTCKLGITNILYISILGSNIDRHH